jgi:predicted AAA+ superfamily ATPase
MLPGVVRPVEIVPIQIEEAANEALVPSTATGPTEAMPTASMPTNQPTLDPDRHWLRGGFPESLAADSDRSSLEWRRAMLEALLSRDYTKWDVERAFPLGNVLRWLANQNGGELDESSCLFANRRELRSGIHVLVKLGLVRRLPNFPAGSSSSMSRKPKLFVRDSGVLHSLLGIETSPQLRSHRDIGGSFESYAGESLIIAGTDRCGAQFYREKGREGEDEIDLILNFPSQNDRRVAIEFKVGTDRSAKKGFHSACAALGVHDRFVVHSGDTAYLGDPVDRLDLKTAIARVSEIARDG